MSEGRRVFVDTSVLLLAVGEGPDRDSCRGVIGAWRASGTEIHVAAETVQEYVHHRLRRLSVEAAAKETAELLTGIVVHQLDEVVLRRGLELIGAGHARGRDAMIAATAIDAGFTTLVSADSDFDRVPGLSRDDPTG